MKKYYEKEYHAALHNYLLSSPEYYDLRAKLAYLDYFRGIDLKNKKVLEFGCGLGQNIYLLSKMGGDVTGYDISKFALDFCRGKGLAVGNNLSRLGKFDIIFSRHVLEHLKNPYGGLLKIRKKLNKNGRLILILDYESHKKFGLGPEANMHLYCWNFRAINNLLYETGFKVLKNRILSSGVGYKKLFFLNKISFGLYNLATRVAGRLMKARELMIVATGR